MQPKGEGMGRVRRDRLPLALGVLVALLLAVPGVIAPPTEGRVVESASWDWVRQGDADRAGDGAADAVGELRWPDGVRAQFVINPAGAPDGAVDAVRSAVSTWMRTGVGVSVDYGGETVERGAAADSVNVVSWIETPDPGDVFVARTTTYWFADAPSEIIGFDLVFNLDHGFDVGVTGLDGGSERWDVETIALHEFGHVLGLGHADPERVLQVMRPRISAGEVDHSLSLRDVDALAALYGDAYSPAPQGFFTPLPERRFRDAGGGHRPTESGLFD